MSATFRCTWPIETRRSTVELTAQSSHAAGSPARGRRGRSLVRRRRRGAGSSSAPASHQIPNASQSTPSTSVWIGPRARARTRRQPQPERGARRPRSAPRARARRAAPSTRRQSQHPEQPRLDAELGVGGLARLDRRAEAERGDAGVPEPVALRMVDDRRQPDPEQVQVAAEGGLARAEQAAAGRQPAVLLRLGQLVA